MRIPRFWQRASQRTITPAGRSWELAAWGWSDESPEAASRCAQERLRAQAAAIGAGKPHAERYAYSDRPLREQVIERPAPGAVITRNAYGSLVLNTARVVFADVDLPEPARPGFLARVFGSAPPPAQPALDEQLRLIEAALRGLGASARVYQTHAGLRLLLTDRTLDPLRPETRELLERLGSDPLYVSLCRQQECFRARLTAKPWRLGLHAPSWRWPFADERSEQAARAWLTGYEAARAGHAATRYLTTFGARAPDEEIRAVIDVHDRLSGAESGLPLA